MGHRQGTLSPRWNLRLGLLLVIFALSACHFGVETPPSHDAPMEGIAAEEDRGAESASMESANMAKKTIRLGTSLYAVRIARAFTPLRISNEDWEDDMVACYHHEETLLDFAVYQFSKEGYADTLEEFTLEEAEDYEASEVVTDLRVNGVAAAYYRSVNEYGGVYRDGLTLVLEDGGEYLEIDFWFIGYQAENEAWEIVRSLEKVETTPLTLGAYQIRIPADFTLASGENTGANPALNANPAVYENGSASLRLYIRRVPGAGKTLAEFVRETDGSDIETDVEINGIPAAFYRSVEALDGTFRSMLTCVLAEGGPDAPAAFAILSFRLDGITAEKEAAAILDTLSA